MVEAITPRDENFTQWYTDVVLRAELIAYSNVKGFMVYKPAGYAIWERIREHLDRRFKETGVQNVYLPLIIPESLLQKEKDHVEGFAPEVAWVTEGGSEPLTERMCIRPTSETLFCDYYKDAIGSYKDLPQLLNQWCSVVRWEKETRPFLRSREFLWQEGHTAHATAEEAAERTQMMLDLYADCLAEDLAIPTIKGRKTEKEKFAGAKETLALEALMHDGRALQAGTSHNFGDGFAKAYGVQYAGKDNRLHYVHQTSWGMTTRMIGALIMVHGDDSGLVLPPRVAPVQIRIIPIRQKEEGVLDAAESVRQAIVTAYPERKLRVQVDASDRSPGFKYAEQEMRGIPLRIEIGPKDLERGVCVLVRRDTREKEECAIADVASRTDALLATIQKDMYARAKAHLDAHIYDAVTREAFADAFTETKGFVRAMWCGERACEEKIKEELNVTSRCIPAAQEKIADSCICCGREARQLVLWGRAY